MLPDRPTTLISLCAKELGLTQSEIFGISLTAPRRYKTFPIDKRNGGVRIICQPARELKAIQYVFMRRILMGAPIHDAATAYRKGRSIRDNAILHRRSRVLLKLDFHDFFHSITVTHWREYVSAVYPDWSSDDVDFSSYILFWGRGGYEPRCLSIGAPSSPMLSNMIMCDFDHAVEDYSNDNGLVYSRYADDMTFSSEDYLKEDDVISAVRKSISVSIVNSLELNDDKTFIASKARTRRVTGLILTNDGRVSLGRDRKRLISAMIDWEKKGKLSKADGAILRGLLAYSYGAEPTFIESLSRKYGKTTINALLFKKAVE